MSGREQLSATAGGTGILSKEARALYLAVIGENGRIAEDAELLRDCAARDELVGLGLLVPDTDEPGVLVAVDPQQLSESLSASWQRQALDLLTRASALNTDLHDLTAAYHSPEQAGGTIEYVRGKVLINQRVQQIVSSATEEILAAQPGGPRPSEALAGILERDLVSLRLGITLRTIYHPSTRYHAPTREYVAAITHAGGRVRTLDEPYTRLIVIDRRIAVIPVAEDLNLAAFIHDQAVISYLISEVFERNWSHALDFDGARAVPQQVVSGMRQTIIDLMLEGVNHRVIARRLGISERTLARHLAEMRDEHNVESLFQLGYALARTTNGEVLPEVFG
ncbi:LuxR family transcriptional regulator [Kitasatospora sp. NPDC089913]|uniref:helix-turn-helix domain-containing protein n=1 Tax=Streptomycetaceae TaxID=2062 RepID=UPI00087D4882|nr:helix-turn-helix domain-containing protein [Streptomyces sp. TLI_053]SDT70242.1 Sugar-specific transcriptional regulator TrmB [Streptomyces sp. TLI_053]